MDPKERDRILEQFAREQGLLQIGCRIAQLGRARQIALMIDAPLVVSLVETRFGGNGRFPLNTQRDFTAFELKSMRRIVDMTLENWRKRVPTGELNAFFAEITGATAEPVTVTVVEAELPAKVSLGA